MVQGDIVSPGESMPARPAEPEAIFCASPTQHPSGWLRLSAHAILSRISERDFAEITMAEYERALSGIEAHRAWQAEVARRRGNSDPRPRVKRSRKHPAIKEDGDVEEGGERQPARAPASAGDGDRAPAH